MRTSLLSYAVKKFEAILFSLSLFLSLSFSLSLSLAHSLTRSHTLPLTFPLSPILSPPPLSLSLSAASMTISRPLCEFCSFNNISLDGGVRINTRVILFNRRVFGEEQELI